MKRREFISSASGAVLGGSLSSVFASKKKVERRNQKPSMEYERLGRTNLMVSRIVHGGLHTNRRRIPLLAKLYEGGVNLFDTSHIYGGGRSEEAFGRFFQEERRRKNVFIGTKMDLRSELRKGKDVYKRAMECAEGSLRRLRTDHVDIMMLHGCTTLIDYIENEQWLKAAEDLKKQGKVRFIGFSEHQKPAEVLKLAASNGNYDMAMVAFSLVKGKWGSLGRYDVKAMKPALEAAKKSDMGVIAIKAALRAERMVEKVSTPALKKKGFSPHQLCYRYVLEVPNVTAVACGMTNMNHVKENLKVPAVKLGMRDVEMLKEAAAESGVCGFCGTCMDVCPSGIAVQDILRFESYYFCGYSASARSAYRGLPPARQAEACLNCGECERACPAGVPVRSRLREAHHALS